MRRTVRLALWSGEEQGLLGSRAYVKETLRRPRDDGAQDRSTRSLSAYFNVDNGTGAIRGVYLQGNEAVAPIFSAWMKPFDDLGMTTLAMRNTGGTDHLSFDAVGLPGFQFIQDPMEYDTRTHHSNMDNYERLQPDDVMKNAVDRGHVRVPRGEPRREAAAQAAARTPCGAVTTAVDAPEAVTTIHQ